MACSERVQVLMADEGGYVTARLSPDAPDPGSGCFGVACSFPIGIVARPA